MQSTVVFFFMCGELPWGWIFMIIALVTALMLNLTLCYYSVGNFMLCCCFSCVHRTVCFADFIPCQKLHFQCSVTLVITGYLLWSTSWKVEAVRGLSFTSVISAGGFFVCLGFVGVWFFWRRGNGNQSAKMRRFLACSETCLYCDVDDELCLRML